MTLEPAAATLLRPPTLHTPRTRPPLHLWGTTVNIVASAADTNGQYAILDYTAPPIPGHGPALHYHREMEETFHVVDGQLTFRVDNATLTADPGTVLHVPPGIPHAFWNASAAPARMIVTFSPPGLERYFEELAELAGEHPTLSPSLRPTIERLSNNYDSVTVGPPPAAVPSR